MSPYRMIRNEARGRLKGNWVPALGIWILPVALLMLLSYGSEYIYFCLGFYREPESYTLTYGQEIGYQAAVIFGVALVMLLVLRPLMLGVRRWYNALAFGNRPDTATVLYYFQKREYRVCISYSLRLLGAVLCAIFPFVLIVLAVTAFILQITFPTALSAFVSGNVSSLSAAEYGVLTTAWACCLPITVLVSVIRCQKLFLADYIFITERDLDAVRCSVDRMNGQYFRSFRTCSRMFFSYLLIIFAFPLVVLLPFWAEVFAVARKWLVYNAHHPEEAVRS